MSPERLAIILSLCVCAGTAVGFLMRDMTDLGAALAFMLLLPTVTVIVWTVTIIPDSSKHT